MSEDNKKPWEDLKTPEEEAVKETVSKPAKKKRARKAKPKKEGNLSVEERIKQARILYGRKASAKAPLDHDFINARRIAREIEERINSNK